MKRRAALVTMLAAAALFAGCATGPKYTEIAKSMTPPKAGEGRIYFFRSSSMLGAALQPEIRLNDVVFGSSKPGGFFFVDRPAGTYKGASSTETEKTLSFALAAGETKYVRTAPSFGVLVGRINLELEDPQKAQTEIETLSFTGGPEVAKK
jgi:hypothetical protein